MIKRTEIKQKTIRYQILGKGKSVLLLHGYLEMLEVWDGFAELLAKDYQVVRMDIPGHGESEVFDTEHNMEAIAERVFMLLDELGIKNINVIGHSMGGYVALAMAHLNQQRIDSMVLFHSTPFADSPEKKTARLREISLIQEGKRDPLYQINIPNMFAQDNLDQFKAQIGTLRILAKRYKSEGIVALIKGMMNRSDHSEVFSKLKNLVVLGKKDVYIQYDAVSAKLKNISGIQITTLENSGHAGFIEEPENSLKILQQFFRN